MRVGALLTVTPSHSGRYCELHSDAVLGQVLERQPVICIVALIRGYVGTRPLPRKGQAASGRAHPTSKEDDAVTVLNVSLLTSLVHMFAGTTPRQERTPENSGAVMHASSLAVASPVAPGAVGAVACQRGNVKPLLATHPPGHSVGITPALLTARFVLTRHPEGVRVVQGRTGSADRHCRLAVLRRHSKMFPAALFTAPSCS